MMILCGHCRNAPKKRCLKNVRTPIVDILSIRGAGKHEESLSQGREHLYRSLFHLVTIGKDGLTRLVMKLVDKHNVRI